MCKLNIFIGIYQAIFGQNTLPPVYKAVTPAQPSSPKVHRLHTYFYYEFIDLRERTIHCTPRTVGIVLLVLESSISTSYSSSMHNTD